MAERAPASRRPQARMSHLHDMGTVTLEAGLVVVTARYGARTVWRRQPGTEWLERVDDQAPLAPEVTPDLSDPRDAFGGFALHVQEGVDG